MPQPPLVRITAALDRVESALQRRASQDTGTAERHAALRGRVAEAVAALDELIARESIG